MVGAHTTRRANMHTRAVRVVREVIGPRIKDVIPGVLGAKLRKQIKATKAKRTNEVRKERTKGRRNGTRDNADLGETHPS